MKQDVETPVRQRCDRGGRQLETQASSVLVNLTVNAALRLNQAWCSRRSRHRASLSFAPRAFSNPRVVRAIQQQTVHSSYDTWRVACFASSAGPNSISEEHAMDSERR
jgi:hypothetical protein